MKFDHIKDLENKIPKKGSFKHMLRRMDEDGRIVKGVNTTPDVDVNQIPKEAGKFGNKVDKDGRPPTLSTKVRGKSTNVLFNLGLAEGYKLQLERDKELLVLNITDTKTGKRTEVRGKPGYESGNYDPNDSLHILLDKVGKSANIAELINGKVVTINPKHPDAKKAKAATDVAYNESTDLDSLRKFVRSQREAPDQVLYQMMMAPDTYGHSASNFVRSWYEKTKEENGLNDVDSALEIMVDQLGMNENFAEGKSPHKKGTKKYKKHMAAKHAAMSESELFDAISDLSPNSKIYVDMDGVLADFFGSWAKLMGKKDWRAIDDIKSGLEKIKQTDNFWLNLPLTANAKNLLSLIKQVKGKYSILSSPLPGDKNSEPHKREWIKKNLGFFPPEEVIITHDKAKYANAGGVANVLIDDYGQNIQKWEGAGGVGFKHKDHKFERTAKNIKQAIDTPAQEGTMIPNPKNKVSSEAFCNGVIDG